MTTLVESPRAALPRDAARELPQILRHAGAVLLAALPGAATAYLSFNAGGFFPGATAVVVAVLAATVALRMALVRRPFAGFSWPLIGAVGAVGFYSLWSLLSSHWSHAPARALVSFNLANVYLFALILLGSSMRSHRRVRWAVALTWLSMLGVCVAALATRLRPDLFAIPANMSPNRLAFPLTYWNALGMFAVIALVLGLYLASSTREPRLLRVLATAATPVFAVTILLTFSRAALVLGAVAVVVYVLLARPRGFLATLIAAGGTTAFAVLTTYHAKLVDNADTTAAAIAQGRHLTTTILFACGASALIRAVLLELDSRLSGITMRSNVRHNARIALAFMCVLAVGAGLVRFGGEINKQWHNFTQQDAGAPPTDVRARLSTFSIASRFGSWKVAVTTFKHHPVDGRGADTYPVAYDQLRTGGGNALEAHSLYLQAMSELGLVGLVPIVLGVLMIIGGCFARARRSARSLWIALGVVGLVWGIHAGVDWDWQMPAVSLPVFALAGCALARRGRGLRLRPSTDVVLRLVVGLASIGVAIAAAHIAVSDTHLDASVTAFNQGDCPTAVTQAQATIGAVSSRPEAYAIVGYCRIVERVPRLAVPEMRAAVARDPQNWRYLYGLALADAASGRNPHGSLQAAARLDPHEAILQAAQRRLGGHNRRHWERAAPHLAMPVSMEE